jgi:hypothetical protein
MWNGHGQKESFAVGSVRMNAHRPTEKNGSGTLNADHNDLGNKKSGFDDLDTRHGIFLHAFL